MAQQQQQSSRLSRLLTLLDTGSTQTTRLTAARQIGDIAKSHPQDLSSLLRKGGASLKKGSEDNGQTAGTGKGIKSILGNLEELWDQSQYTEEYNLSHFLAKLDGQ